jgi:hypothetical protein
LARLAGDIAAICPRGIRPAGIAMAYFRLLEKVNSFTVFAGAAGGETAPWHVFFTAPGRDNI